MIVIIKKVVLLMRLYALILVIILMVVMIELKTMELRKSYLIINILRRINRDRNRIFDNEFLIFY